MYKEIFKEAKEMEAELISFRRTLHQTPEVGMELPKTGAFVKEKLEEFGIPCKTKLNGSLVVGTLGEGEKCFLLRADMDGLPMAEETGLPFASKNGRMHACGHDLHTAALLGAAKILKKREGQLKGRVKLLFQPGEEIFAGAKAAIKAGVLEKPKVDASFAVHVVSGIPSGNAAWGKEAAAAVYGFRIKLTGKGTHGAMPEQGIDPINAGVHVYLALQELLTREISPNVEAALTIGRFSAGSAANIIPETAVLEGTLRMFDEEAREYLIKRIGELTREIARAYRTEAELEVLSDVPALICQEEMGRQLQAAFQEMNPELKILSSLHGMGSEDFAFLAKEVPSSYFVIGAMDESGEKVYAHHNPKVRFQENALITGAGAYACAALEWLRRNVIND